MSGTVHSHRVGVGSHTFELFLATELYAVVAYYACVDESLSTLLQYTLTSISVALILVWVGLKCNFRDFNFSGVRPC